MINKITYNPGLRLADKLLFKAMTVILSGVA